MSLIILSVGYVVKEANHDCTGEDCPVCVQIEQCLNNFRTLGTGTRIQSEIFVIEKFFGNGDSFCCGDVYEFSSRRHR